MRIITGLYKGRTIRTVPDLSVRPATDRVRQTIFNMLAYRMTFDDATVLDLFAGSGSLGLEALSRGAANVTFVESGQAAADKIEENLRAFGSDRGVVIREDAISYLARASNSCDLIFADPPYSYGGTSELPSLVFGRRLVTSRGYLLIEHTKEISFASTPLYTIRAVKRFGRTFVTFIQGPEQ
jgi:16S rRNA (guanine(966)-N(2))-methyltransferase RsmD